MHTLSIVERGGVQRAWEWLGELRGIRGPGEDPEVDLPLAVLARAVAGEPMVLSRYHDGMDQQQAGELIGGHISRAAKRWKSAFPEEKHEQDIEQLETGLAYTYLNQAEAKALVEGSSERIRRRMKRARPQRFQGEELTSYLAYREELKRHLIIRPAVDRGRPRWHNRIFSRKKQSGKLRWILDRSGQNMFQREMPFKMTGVAVLRSIILPGDWMISIDLKDAYLNIRIHSSQRKC